MNQPRVRVGAIEEDVIANRHDRDAPGTRPPADERVAPELPQPVCRGIDRTQRFFVPAHGAMMRR